MSKKLTTALVAVAFLIGGGVGAVTSSAKTVTVPGPERIVTVDVPGPTVEVLGPERVVTETVTPDACITALDLADEALLLAADGFEAVSKSDASGLRTMNTRLPKTMSAYRGAKDTCRAAN